MFSRRTIQTLIERVAVSMTPAQLDSLIERLNKTDRAALEATWELIWLVSLSANGEARHEPGLPGATRFPDIHFRSAGLEFIADVATVSDVGYEDENPVEELRRGLDRLYAKYGLFGGFSVSSIEAKQEGPYGDRKVKLLLPSRAEIPKFIRVNFEPFVRAVAAAPEQKAAHRASIPSGGSIYLDYSPSRRPYNVGPGHLGFDVPYSLKRNPVANVLKAKKRQLAGANFSGLRGVILCDGDCSMLANTLYSATAYTVEQIVRDFLRQNTSLGFVLATGVTTRHQPLGQPQWTYPLKLELYCQPALDAAQIHELENLFNSAAQQIPVAHRTPRNALLHLTHGSPPPARFSDHFGHWRISEGHLMQNTEISISARTLSALLGGEIELKEFRELHRVPTNNGTPPIEPLQRALAEGRQLVGVRLDPLPDEDDDLVVLRFGRADPAKSKFCRP